MENSIHMIKMGCPGFNIDEDIIKKKLRQNDGRHDS
jgi:hypothetical protein